MAETVHDRINNYLEDAIAAERNFEDALKAFGRTGNQPTVRKLMTEAGIKARGRHMRMTALLEQRGGSPSVAKSALAHMLAFAPLTAQTGHTAEEKNTQQLIVAFGASGAESAMYQALGQAAEEAGEATVVSLARELAQEEADDARQVWPLLSTSARDSFRAALSDGATIGDVLRNYLEDLVAAEKGFESRFNSFAKEADYAPAQTVFREHADEARRQSEQLTTHLKSLGGSTSAPKAMLAQLFAAAPRAAQIGHDAAERLTQNLMIAHSIQCAEAAMYEVFATVASDAGHHDLEELANAIQKHEREAADKVWSLVGPCARRAIQQVKQLPLRKAS